MRTSDFKSSEDNLPVSAHQTGNPLQIFILHFFDFELRGFDDHHVG
jgi:hypothetical protein